MPSDTPSVGPPETLCIHCGKPRKGHLRNIGGAWCIHPEGRVFTVARSGETVYGDGQPVQGTAPRAIAERLSRAPEEAAVPTTDEPPTCPKCRHRWDQHARYRDVPWCIPCWREQVVCSAAPPAAPAVAVPGEAKSMSENDLGWTKNPLPAVAGSTARTEAPRDASAGCSCAAWRENIGKLDAPFTLLTARNPGTYRGYEGVIFSYCPWCGMRLP